MFWVLYQQNSEAVLTGTHVIGCVIQGSDDSCYRFRFYGFGFEGKSAR